MNYQLKGNQITFLDNRFYYHEGNFYPSVTTILQAYPKDAHFYKWLKEVGNDADTIRDAAGDRGSTVHQLTEKYDEGLEVSLISEDGKLNFSMQEWSMFERYVNFRQRFPLKIIQSEMQVISPTYQEAGTVDRLIEMDGKIILIDIKTSNNLYDHYWLQVAAYKRMVEEVSGLNIDAVGILWLNAKTRTNGTKGATQGEGWQLITRDDTANDLALYEATKALWKHQNKDARPREISYTLKHSINATP
jgi:hypothetical protein